MVENSDETQQLDGNTTEETVAEPEGDVIEEDSGEDLVGGLEFDTTAQVEVPDRLIDQVIGQEHARNVIRTAAEQHRHVMMIGSPGTGKSMLSKAMTELLGSEDLRDVLAYRNPKDDNNPRIRTVPSGTAEQIIQSHDEEAQQQQRLRKFLMWGVIAAVAVFGFIRGSFLLGIIAAAVLYVAFKYGLQDVKAEKPNIIVDNSDQDEAPFKDATSAHDGALLGDVRHDPFQSGGMETPAHQRVEPGAIHESSNGVLYIDEINTLDIRQQQKLMTAIQEGEFHITGQSQRSSGAMVKTEPVPTDFILVAAGNMDAMENMHPALRSRIQGYGYEVYFDDTIEDTQQARQKFGRFVAQEVDRDGTIPEFTRAAVEEIVLEAQRRAGQKDKLTLELRDLGGLVRTAGDIAKADPETDLTTRSHVLDAKRRDKSIEQQYATERIEQKKKYGQTSDSPSVIGRVNGLAVMGDDSGIVLPVMGKVSPAQGGGRVIATGQLQDIAQEAVENVSAIIKDIGGEDIQSKDVHIQFVQTYEGVDGDSASVTVATAVLSALEDIPIRQDVAMTGSLSVRGDVLPVGGVTHKIEAAAKAGMETVIIPETNKQDVMIEDEYQDQVDIVTAKNIGDVLEVALEGDAPAKETILDKLRNLANSPALDSGNSSTAGD